MRTFKVTMRVLIISVVVFFIGRGVKLYFYDNLFDQDFCDCGIIQSKGNDEVSIKHGTRTDLYLNIQFKKQGFMAKSVGATTYFKHKVGEKVCFDFEVWPSGWDYANMFISLLIIGCALFGMFVYFLVFIFDFE